MQKMVQNVHMHNNIIYMVHEQCTYVYVCTYYYSKYVEDGSFFDSARVGTRGYSSLSVLSVCKSLLPRVYGWLKPQSNIGFHLAISEGK